MTSMSQLLYFTWVKHIQFNQFHLIPESLSDEWFLSNTISATDSKTYSTTSAIHPIPQLTTLIGSFF